MSLGIVHIIFESIDGHKVCVSDRRESVIESIWVDNRRRPAIDFKLNMTDFTPRGKIDIANAWREKEDETQGHIYVGAYSYS